MGHRKKNPNPNSSSTSPSSPAEESPSAGVKAECDLRLGNYSRALKIIMKDAVGRHDHSSALLHRVHGTVAVKAASVLDDDSSKLRLLRAAVESARRAAELSPKSVEFAHFHANLLSEALRLRVRGRGPGVRALSLSIADPVDPALEPFQDDTQMHQELRSLIQKANHASISNWTKNISAGGNSNGEKFRLIPTRHLSSPVEDPMEMRLEQAPRRPNEIKKASNYLNASLGVFEVNCSKDVKVSGILGPCASLEKKGPLCSETAVGQGNTSAWKICGLDKKTSVYNF